MADMHFKDTVTKRAATEKARVSKGGQHRKRGRRGEGPSHKKMKVCFTFAAALRAINF